MNSPPLNGTHFRAVRRLSTGHDETLADVGETCERVPASSLSWLLTDRLIEPIEPPPAPVADAREDHDGG